MQAETKAEKKDKSSPKVTQKGKSGKKGEQKTKVEETKKSSNYLSTILIVLLVLAIIGGGGFATYYFFFSEEASLKKVIVTDNVNVLSDYTFNSFLDESSFTLVKFFTPWCGHCKKLAPEFVKAAAITPDVKFAEIDCSKSKTICQSQGIEGYPTMKFFKFNSFITNYDSDRKSDAISNWATKKTGMPFAYIQDQVDMQERLQANQVFIVFFGDDQEKVKTFSNIALKYDDLEFGLIVDESLFGINNVANKNSLVLFKQFDELRNDFEGEFTTENVVQFIEEFSLNSVEPFSMKVVKKTIQAGKPFFTVFYKDELEKDIFEEFRVTALELKGEIMFTKTDFKDELGARLVEIAGVAEEDLPCVRLIYAGRKNIQKYVFTEQIQKEKLIEFYNDFKNKKLKPSIKSEKIPTESEQGPVIKLVGLTFDDIVRKSDKDVLVKFYAPWCGHCKAMAPKYEELAKQLKDNENIIIADIDATKNDITGIDIQGYPTVKFFKNGSKNKPIEYEGQRDVESFMEFLKENTSYPFAEEEKTQEAQPEEEAKTQEEL